MSKEKNMVELLLSWDQAFLHQINQVWVTPALDRVMAILSSFALFKLPLLVGVFILLWKGGFRERLFLVLIGVLLLVGDVGIGQTLKKSVARPRPHETLAGVRIVTLDEIRWSEPSATTHGRSFPSGHTCNNVALAVLLIRLYGWRGAWAIPWALAVGYSRIYTGSHYPSDVIGSIGIAVIYAWGTLEILHWIWKRYAIRWMPALVQSHPRWW